MIGAKRADSTVRKIITSPKAACGILMTLVVVSMKGEVWLVIVANPRV